jgi:hypothetical protein
LAYWKGTSDFWSEVRARWVNRFAANGSITLSLQTGDESFNTTLLDLGDAYMKNPQFDLYRKQLDDAFSKFVNVNTPAPAIKR